MEYVITTKNLTKKFKNHVVVNHMNLAVKKGDIFGFVGANGAGKTTTMKMILNLLYVSEGEIELFGSKLTPKSLHKVGSLIEEPGLYKKCSAFENMKRFSILYGSTDEKIKEILEMVGLGNTGSKKAGDFSLGMRQRLGIAIAMLGEPELLILDEPINGLDPVGIKEIRDVILRINKEKNVTFFISSHLLEELSKIATTYGIISNGHLVEEMSAEELQRRCKESLTIRCDNPQKAVEIIQNQCKIQDVKLTNDLVVVSSHMEDSAIINEALVLGKVRVSELSVQNNSFENYFMERIGE